MITINKQIEGLSAVKITPQNFPRLFDGKQRVRDISIVSNDTGLDIQTILDAEGVVKAVTDFCNSREKYSDIVFL
nr:MAG TPA: hypothetical protein [Caudoviricetes sp.]